MSELIRVVSGQGRCGSSLVMQAFIKVGYPVFQTSGPPLYEMIRTDPDRPITADVFLKETPGKVCKVLGPKGLLALPWHDKLRVLWLWRDFDEQTKSVIKYRKECLDDHPTYERVMKSTKIKQEAALEILNRSCKVSGAKALHLRFEFLLSEPYLAFRKILDLFEIDTIDPWEMAKAVKPRTPKCLDTLMEKEVYKDATGKDLDPKDINDGHKMYHEYTASRES